MLLCINGASGSVISVNRVKVRKEDVSVIQASIKTAKDEFTKIMKIEVVVEPENIACMGGVICGSANWNLQCNNTLDERLALLKEMMLPDIRTDLFGPSPNRKFFT